MNGLLGDFFGTFLRNRGAAAGLAVLALVGVAAGSAGLLFPYSPWDMRGAPFMPPGEMEFLLGSDSLGRDVAAGIAYGARVSLLIGAVSTVVAVMLGITLGAVAGNTGQWTLTVTIRGASGTTTVSFSLGESPLPALTSSY